MCSYCAKKIQNRRVPHFLVENRGKNQGPRFFTSYHVISKFLKINIFVQKSPLYNHKINQDEHFNKTGCVVTPHLRYNENMMERSINGGMIMAFCMWGRDEKADS